MAEDLNGYFSSMFFTQNISFLLIPDAKFQEAKSDYLKQFTVTPEMVDKTIKVMKDHRSPVVEEFRQNKKSVK